MHIALPLWSKEIPQQLHSTSAQSWSFSNLATNIGSNSDLEKQIRLSEIFLFFFLTSFFFSLTSVFLSYVISLYGPL